MPAGDYVLIEVADTGKGIPKENLAKIFDPFFTTKPVGQGTGLGLSTVYGVVKQSGGFITVDSDLGKGTIFQIYLPRHAATEAEAAVPDEPERAAHRDVTGQDTILLVEDEDAVRSFAARALRMRGYTVMEASGGEAALDIVRKHPGAIDLLISDVVMPNMDGPTLVRAASRLRPEMRVIFMSGYAEDAFRRNEEKAEELHFLPKPFGLKQLVAKVKEVLSGRPARELKPFADGDRNVARFYRRCRSFSCSPAPVVMSARCIKRRSPDVRSGIIHVVWVSRGCCRGGGLNRNLGG